MYIYTILVKLRNLLATLFEFFYSEPSAPREVEVVPITMATILVSWLPPDPTNGIILDYRVQVFTVASGELFATQTVAVGANEQEDVQLVNFSGLDLENMEYRVSVSARTAAGRGPESDPVIVGMTPTG